jgi:hypothetical protein
MPILPWHKHCAYMRTNENYLIHNAVISNNLCFIN